MRILLLLAMLLQGVFCISMPGDYLRDYLNFRVYPEGAPLSVEAHGLSSAMWQLQSYDYYSFPFCKPQGGVKRSARSLGQIVMDQVTTNSPFNFHMNMSESGILCTSELSETDADHFKSLVDRGYRAHLTLDKLPVLWLPASANEPNSPTTGWLPTGALLARAQPQRLLDSGFPVGEMLNGKYQIFNHLNFTVLINSAPPSEGGNVSTLSVVGFRVSPRTGEQGVQVKAGANVTFSYEVHFEPTPMEWPFRWESYRPPIEDSDGYFVLLVSVVVVSLNLANAFGSARRDIMAANKRDIEALRTDPTAHGWKRIAGDIFRTPPYSKQFCIMFGSGVHILGMALLLVVLVGLGFLPQIWGSMVLTWMLICYLASGTCGGFAACWLFRTMGQGDSTGWKSVAWGVACFFPALAFGVLGCTNYVLQTTQPGTVAISTSGFLTLLSLWFGILVPLTLLGGYLGVKVKHVAYASPVRHGRPRKIPSNSAGFYWMVFFMQIVMVGFVHVCTVTSLSEKSHDLPALDLVHLILVSLLSAELAMSVAFVRVSIEDWRWWWPSLLTSCASVATIPVSYTVYFAGWPTWSIVATTPYVAYASVAVLGVMLAGGAIDFFCTFCTLYLMYSCLRAGD